ncbi:MAG TPA: hypothetical protein PLO56_14900 [Rhodothermales bacterium]|nr:hypothetical protein [Rhodothermales bacterium]
MRYLYGVVLFMFGSSGAELAPKHTYAKRESYTLKLTALNGCGTDFLPQTIVVEEQRRLGPILIGAGGSIAAVVTWLLLGRQGFPLPPDRP